MLNNTDDPDRLTFPPWPVYGADEIEAVSEVLKSGKVNYLLHFMSSPGLTPFEQAFADLCHTDYAVAVANGTVALELALYALEIGAGDEVIVPSRSFIASASCVAVRGARPVFAEVEADSQNLDPGCLPGLLTSRTKAILVVHLAGWPCDMDAILSFARDHHLAVIEDCAQAHGATYKGRPVGSFGDVAAFSFCTDKMITTGGEGGMLVTSHPNIWQRAWSYKDHGRSYSLVAGRQELSQRRNLYERIGTNWRLTQMQAAIGLQQMAKLPGWLRERRNNASRLNSLLAHVPGLRLTIPSQEYGHAYYKYYVHVRPEMLARGWNRDRIWQAVEARGIPCQLGSDAEIYLDKVFQDRGWQPAVPWPVARQVGQSSLVFPVHPGLQDHHMVRIGETLAAVMKLATTGGHEDA